MSDNLLLTPAERERFAAWLEREAATSKKLIEQLEKIGPYTGPLIMRERAEMSASLIIAKKLRATESDSVGG